jgi:bifunctional non-homologous end joining protein LigD
MPTIAAFPDIRPVPFLPATEPFDGADWLFEPDYDGFRALLHVSADGCEFHGRQDGHYEDFADLRDRVARVLPGREAILDGQILSLDPRGKPVFRELLKGRGYLAFAAADLLWLDGRDLRGLPLVERKARLAELLPSDTGPLYKVFSLEEHGRALFQAARRLDLAGVLAKGRHEVYHETVRWYRLRNPAYRQGDQRLDLAHPPARARRELKD